MESSTNPELTMTTQTTALDAYLARVTAIHIKLARLRQLAKERFGHDPESIHWGHVGDLGRVDQAQDDLLQRGWIEPADGGYLQIDAGYAAIGQLLPVPLDDVQPVDASDDLQRISPAAATAAPDGSAEIGDRCFVMVVAAPDVGQQSLADIGRDDFPVLTAELGESRQ